MVVAYYSADQNPPWNQAPFSFFFLLVVTGITGIFWNVSSVCRIHSNMRAIVLFIIFTDS
jgi:hypothetical protein